VFLFDFPNSIGDYANCIGRTARPGQRGGRVVAFLPEGRFWIAGELIALLE
jgi:superfamily II DNA/RNA helicase